MTTGREIAILAVAAMAALTTTAAMAKDPKSRDLALAPQAVGRLTIMTVADTPTNIYSVGFEEVEFDFQTIESSANGASYCFNTVALGGC